jgi:hypothetical protein
VEADLIEKLAQRGIETYAAPTSKAVKLYNRLNSEKKVVAALHLTC